MLLNYFLQCFFIKLSLINLNCDVSILPTWSSINIAFKMLKYPNMYVTEHVCPSEVK